MNTGLRMLIIAVHRVIAAPRAAALPIIRKPDIVPAFTVSSCGLA